MNSVNEKNMQTLVKGLLDHSRSRLEVVYEYLNISPSLANNVEINASLQQLELSLENVKKITMVDNIAVEIK